MPSLNDAPMRGPEYWRSLDHLSQTPEFREFMHREFPAGASELLEGDRRQFLKIMGASMALAGLGLAGCRRWPEEYIVPFAGRPEEYIPGQALHYATMMSLGGVAQPLLATCFDGRPTKIEGNPDHAASRGASSAHAQASVLDMYDPDRSRGVRRAGEAASWNDFLEWSGPHFASLRGKRGAGLLIIAEADDSPTMRRLREELVAVMPQAVWAEWEPVHGDNRREGSRLAFGAAHRVHYRFAQAKTIVSLDADFMSQGRDAIANIRGFADSRRLSSGPEMSRFYAVETDLSLSGANADERAAMRGADIGVAAAYLAMKLGVGGEDGRLSDAANTALSAEVREMLDHAAADLGAHRGAGIVVAGDGQPPAVHVLVHAINAALGNHGTTVLFTAETGPAAQSGHRAGIEAAAQAINAGQVDTLLVIGANPAYTAPADLDFSALIARVAHSVHLGDYVDETGALCTWHINRAHYLEAWADGRTWDGTYCTAQPMIEPLWDGHSAIELIALVTHGSHMPGSDLVRETFRAMSGTSDEKVWRRVLHDGLRGDTADAPVGPSLAGGAVAAAKTAVHEMASASREGWEVVFTPHPALYDGRFANNGWLQELPDAISKLTWDTAALISPADATELGLRDGDVIRISVNGRSVEAPVLRVPGIANRSLVLPLGGGRRMEGRICTGAGFDSYALRTTRTLDRAAGATVSATGAVYKLATTQDHHTIDVETVGGRGAQQRIPSIAREGDLNEYRAHPDFAKHRAHVVHRLSMWDSSEMFAGAQYAWAMSIDLNACVGCGACVVACQAENNIPIVGKDQVIRGREMSWLRIDRYFKFASTTNADGGRTFDPNRMTGVLLQPVACMHCENAPCEQVCPVAATVHDMDGLNVMVYNRCIGTRYCSNNCPYKVRRFNYFDYHRREPLREQKGLLQVQPDYFTRRQAAPHDLLQMQFNPEVTVRMRGVMEKCTYCTQRIADAKIRAKNAWAKARRSEANGVEGEIPEHERVAIRDGELTPACAQACPAEAIIFGDLLDPNSRVSKLHASERSYEMLEELHVKARTRYLAKVRNPRGGGSAGTGAH